MSARVLNEGIDVPDADVAVIVSAALGEREHVQRVGRLLRPGEGKRAIVYELVSRDTIEVGQAAEAQGALLPGPLLNYSVVGNTLVPHFLGEHDHPGCGFSSRSMSGSWGNPSARSTRACKSLCPARVPTKRKQAVHVLSCLRPSPRKTVVPPSRAREMGLRGSRPHTGRGRRRHLRGCRVSQSECRRSQDSLFADLPGERLVAAPPEATLTRRGWHSGPISPSCGRCSLRATSVTIEADGNARALVRHSKLRGLICTVAGLPSRRTACWSCRGRSRCSAIPGCYGHALGELVPLLAWCRRFRLRAECVVEGRRLTLALGTGDPIFPADEPRRYDSQLEERFARDFRRIAPDWDVLREPEPVPVGDALIFPDFALHHRRDAGRRWLLEIVGFWTADYSARKLLQYRSAHLSNLILCIDEDRNLHRG